MSKARVRDLESGIPPATIQLEHWECEHLRFEYHVMDNQPTDFEEGYNMVLVHPTSGKLFWAYSIDFDFE